MIVVISVLGLLFLLTIAAVVALLCGHEEEQQLLRTPPLCRELVIQALETEFELPRELVGASGTISFGTMKVRFSSGPVRQCLGTQEFVVATLSAQRMEGPCIGDTAVLELRLAAAIEQGLAIGQEGTRSPYGFFVPEGSGRFGLSHCTGVSLSTIAVGVDGTVQIRSYAGGIVCETFSAKGEDHMQCRIVRDVDAGLVMMCLLAVQVFDKLSSADGARTPLSATMASEAEEAEDSDAGLPTLAGSH